jgi:Nuclear pore protein 84 / 107
MEETSPKKVASEHQEQLYQQDLARWNITLKDTTKIAKDLLYNVLLFPEKGWLVDPEDVQPEFTSDMEVNAWENRKIQMDSNSSRNVLLWLTVSNTSWQFRNSSTQTIQSWPS